MIINNVREREEIAGSVIEDLKKEIPILNMKTPKKGVAGVAGVVEALQGLEPVELNYIKKVCDMLIAKSSL